MNRLSRIGAGRPLAAALGCLLLFSTHPGKPVAAQAPSTVMAERSSRNANYEIDATLDVTTSVLTGREVITWRNDRSSYMRSARRRGGAAGRSTWPSTVRGTGPTATWSRSPCVPATARPRNRSRRASSSLTMAMPTTGR